MVKHHRVHAQPLSSRKQGLHQARDPDAGGSREPGTWNREKIKLAQRKGKCMFMQSLMTHLAFSYGVKFNSVTIKRNTSLSKDQRHKLTASFSASYYRAERGESPQEPAASLDTCGTSVEHWNGQSGEIKVKHTIRGLMRTQGRDKPWEQAAVSIPSSFQGGTAEPPSVFLPTTLTWQNLS